MEDKVVIRRKDDTDAFGMDFLTINVELPTGWVVSAAEFVCRDIKKRFENPVFPIDVALSSEETAMLEYKNEGNLILYDENGKKFTCDGEAIFYAEPEVD